MVSAEPSSAEQSFPQLEVATDPELMREVFQRHLRPLGKKAYQVRECRISYTYYQQALHYQQALDRYTLQYTLRLVEPGTGHERSQLVNCVMHAGGRTRQTWEKLRQSDPRLKAPDASPAFAPFRWVSEKLLRRSEPGGEAPGASPAFAPFYYIPELEMLVQVFPFDHRLPALPLLMAGLPPELEPQILAQFGPGDWRVEAWDVQPVRYLPETRATLLLTARARDAATGRAEERRFYGKVYNTEKGEQTYRVLRALWDTAAAEGGVGFAVGKPVAYLSDLRTLIQEETPGTSLKDILLQEDELIPVVRRVARDLATLHLAHADTPRRYRLHDELPILKKIGKRLQQACPHLSPQIEEIVSTVVDGLEEVPPAPTHGDLKPVHILVDGDRLALIDFDDFAGADPVRDVARMLVFMLKTVPPRPYLSHDDLASLGNDRASLSQDRPRAVTQAFAEEYFALVPEAWRARLPLRYAGAALKLAGGSLRRQHPGWTDSVEALVEEARASVAGKVW